MCHLAKVTETSQLQEIAVLCPFSTHEENMRVVNVLVHDAVSVDLLEYKSKLDEQSSRFGLSISGRSFFESLLECASVEIFESGSDLTLAFEHIPHSYNVRMWHSEDHLRFCVRLLELFLSDSRGDLEELNYSIGHIG